MAKSVVPRFDMRRNLVRVDGEGAIAVGKRFPARRPSSRSNSLRVLERRCEMGMSREDAGQLRQRIGLPVSAGSRRPRGRNAPA